MRDARSAAARVYCLFFAIIAEALFFFTPARCLLLLLMRVADAMLTCYY